MPTKEAGMGMKKLFVIGGMGAGKSTALNILGCLDAPTSGAYVFKNVRVDTLTHSILRHVILLT